MIETKLNPTARQMVEDQPIATCFMGNQYAAKLLQVCQLICVFNTHVKVVKMNMGVLELYNNDA